MGLFDVLSGRKPLFRSDSIKQAIVDIERDFSNLINSTPKHNEQRFPRANPQVYADAYAQDTDTTPRAAARYTLTRLQPVKVADTRNVEKRIFFTVVRPGQTAFVSHDRIRLQHSQQGIQEGIPVTNAGVGEPALTVMPWQGEMWCVGSVDGMVVDVEMS
jgi:hypothetical protein